MNNCQRLISSCTSSGNKEVSFPTRICKIQILFANTNTKSFKLNYCKILFSLWTFIKFPLRFPRQPVLTKCVEIHFIITLKSLFVEVDWNQQIYKKTMGGHMECLRYMSICSAESREIKWSCERQHRKKHQFLSSADVQRLHGISHDQHFDVKQPKMIHSSSFNCTGKSSTLLVQPQLSSAPCPGAEVFNEVAKSI